MNKFYSFVEACASHGENTTKCRCIECIIFSKFSGTTGTGIHLFGFPVHKRICATDDERTVLAK